VTFDSTLPAKQQIEDLAAMLLRKLEEARAAGHTTA